MTRSIAQRLRANTSSAEHDAWVTLRLLRDEGFHLRRQHPIGRYVVDFAIARARLAIELDGPVHDLPANTQRDAERQTYIENMGWRVLRIPARVAYSPDQLLDIVRAALSNSPSPEGEGVRGRGEARNSPERRTRANRKLPSRAKS